jgi:V8-like Glu-specific endopeptidase
MRHGFMGRCGVAACAVLASLSGTASGQVAPLSFDRVDLAIDSGVVQTGGVGVLYSETVEAPGADWIRVWFGETTIPEGTELLITSARTGAVHRLTAETLAQWNNSSAYLAGDVAYVDLVVPADAPAVTETARVRVIGVDAGLPPIAGRSICDGADDRVLSNDPRAARLAPIGCTAWLFNNRPNSAITANHCSPGGGDTIWFNVPLRTAGGSVVPPLPEDQYPVDNSSVQGSGGSSIGNDWSVFGVFSNSNTGLSPVDAQLDSYLLATAPPPADGRPINITGYGSTSFPIPPAWYAVQKTHTGPLFSVSGSTIRYRPDTTGGNSGSAVYDEQDGMVVGIHTNGGCGSSSTSSNSGTSIANSGWRSAVMQSRGIAGGPTAGVIRVLGERPATIDPAGGTEIGVALDADFTNDAPQQGVTMHVNDGSGWVESAMNAGFAGDWFGAFPATACGAEVSYYFSAQGAGGSMVTFPPSAPGVTLRALSSEPMVEIASANGESSDDWTVENTGVFSGGWERGVPNLADRGGGPVTDADGSGACWTTGLGTSVNLNGGPTVLTTPDYDLGGATGAVFADVSLYMNADGGSDVLRVQASADGGASWTPIEDLGSTPGWSPRSYGISEVFPGASSVRLRFVVADAGGSDTIEAGVDGFALRFAPCGPASCGDADLTEPFGVLDLADVQGFVMGFLKLDPATDLAAPEGVWDLNDVSAFVSSFEGGCP